MKIGSPQIIFVLLAGAHALAGCARTISSNIDQNVVDSATAAATAVGGTIEDDAGTPVSSSDLPDGENRATVATRSSRSSNDGHCETLGSQTCAAGVRSVTYESCLLGNGGSRLSGAADLNFSAGNCKFTAWGDTITRRTHSVLLALSSGTLFFSTTDDVTDYLGDSFGSGGSQVRLGKAGFAISIQNRKTLKRAGDAELTYDLTERTDPEDPLLVHGGLARKSRKIRSGTLVIYHNLAKFTATHHFTDVSWGDASCCFPLRGSSAITFSGAVAGEAKIEFGPGCGEYTITREEDSRTGVLTVCGR